MDTTLSNAPVPTQETDYLDLVADLSGIVLDESHIGNGIGRVLRRLNDALGFPRSIITIFNRKSGRITIKEACGVSDEEKDRGVYSLGEGIIGRVIDSGEAIIVEDIGDDSRFLNRTGFRGREGSGYSFLCVPIKAGPEVIGALSAYSERMDMSALAERKRILSIAGSILFHAVQRSQAQEEELQILREENDNLHQRLGDKPALSAMVGNSKLIHALNQLASKIAVTDATVLILGESGVGKGLLAQAIHESSKRRGKPFVKLNCAALSESIIESELFGHERGAFTGAIRERKGRFELAGDGSIFLDEIGELSLNTQAKLLRVLQEREYERVGGSQTLKAGCRMIAATNKDLTERVRLGEFREDLFYRLNVFPITVPPLRERKSDIILLADFFIERFNRQNGKSVRRISTPAIDMLMAYHWPGNIRELENAIERAVILSEDDTIHGYHLPPSLQIAEPHLRGAAAKDSGAGLDQRLCAMEYEMIVEALKQTGGKLARSARILGLTERVIGIRAKKYGIDFKLFRRRE